MALIDKIAAKSKEFSTKAKEYANVTSINAGINVVQNKLDGYYREIGFQYYQMAKDNPAPDFIGLFRSIEEGKAEIEAYKVQLLQVKGVKNCIGCGAEMRAFDTMCTVCGTRNPLPEGAAAAAPPPGAPPPGREAEHPGAARQTEGANGRAPEPPAAAAIPCHACGAAMDAEMAFCGKCGAKAEAPQEVLQETLQGVNEEIDAPEESLPEEEVAATEEAVAPGPSQCKACGAVLEEDAMFCGICGARVDAPQEEPVGGHATEEAVEPPTEEPLPETPLGPAGPKAAEPEPARCPQCGAVFEEDAMFCGVCGEKIG